MVPSPSAESTSPAPSLAQARWCVLGAAVLWSLSGAFSKALTEPTPLHTNVPSIDPVPIACYRALFAALSLTPLLRRREVRFRPAMVLMGLSFAAMNLMFITANALGTAANATFLQYTAPFWMYLASVFWLGEPADRRGTISLFAGLAGIAVIIAGGWQDGQLPAVAFALGSGIAYTGVVIGLRVLRNESSRWLTVWNLGLSGLLLVPLIVGHRLPSVAQFVVLVLFGVMQLAAPYWLMARGLRVIGPAEAGTLTLLEPMLNPVWTFLISGERPQPSTFIGGAIVLLALAWRYAPGLRQPAPRSEPSEPESSKSP
jgi:drug/metabolite transporter (DMT)-like permease